MSSVQINGRDLALNTKGFLADFVAWSDEVAEVLAAEDGVTLTDCHWTVIRFLREYYHQFEVPPSPRVMIKAVGDRIARGGTCTRKNLEGLFPKGGCKQACRIAGLPDHYCHSC